MNSLTINTFRLAAPFWLGSARRRTEWMLAAALLALVVTYSGLNLWLNKINKAFYDALQNLDAPAFNQSVTMFSSWWGFWWWPSP
jgi:putative ATP-binding cassette transporter